MEVDNTKKKFILTDCEETAQLLLNAKYQLAWHTGNTWLFVNDPHKMVFTDLKSAVYTNKYFT